MEERRRRDISIRASVRARHPRRTSPTNIFVETVPKTRRINITEMAQGIPSWLNLEFVEGVLRRSEDDNSIRVIDIFSKAATSKGDNYTSDMLRVFIEFSRQQGNETVTEKKSIIVKLAPSVGARGDLIEKADIFSTEIIMMTNTLKKMNDMLENGYRLSGRCLHMKLDHPSFLVIEDLAPLGFRMADRHAGLDLAHSILAIQGLAKFHATSVALCEKEPEQKKHYTRGIFSPLHADTFSPFFSVGVKALADEVENWPELGKSYADKIRKLSTCVYEKGMAAIKCNENQFNVINHGDSWVNNMLFRYNDEGQLCGHIFVDFQMCVYTSPAIDLLYFLSTSPSEEVTKDKTDLLLDEYHRTLTSTMERVGCKTSPPSMDDLKRHMKERAMYGVISAFTVLPLVLLDKNEAMDIDQLIPVEGEEFSNPAYKSEHYRRVITKKILIYDSQGLLDV